MALGTTRSEQWRLADTSNAAHVHWKNARNRGSNEDADPPPYSAPAQRPFRTQHVSVWEEYDRIRRRADFLEYYRVASLPRPINGQHGFILCNYSQMEPAPTLELSSARCRGIRTHAYRRMLRAMKNLRAELEQRTGSGKFNKVMLYRRGIVYGNDLRGQPISACETDSDRLPPSAPV
ncbi:hypothetical protein SAPIO_CDS6794 [Scedosporium apiospermum]|uniref:Uncharacterized protein n=1 Tax=Pseudallescheria apiosperma TaxID=563466 RepID=A0A084G391_PSEDA|nr:uncharacterized protein SAPIO_CDS6794 [Scedosporium apiospermum]KEZ41803.1 hypothetical protein SAPIO_CDS6794 [Scedosporium apiospermum]